MSHSSASFPQTDPPESSRPRRNSKEAISSQSAGASQGKDATIERRTSPCFSNLLPKSLVAGLFVFAPAVLWGASDFTPLIFTDADPAGQHLGLTEYRSSKGRLNLVMSAQDDYQDVEGSEMSANPVLGPTFGAGQFIYPRLGYVCSFPGDTPPFPSFAGPLLRVFPGDHVHISFTNGLFTQRTNLHFHGLPVSPHASNNPAGLFGDYVSLPYVIADSPGNTRIYDFVIPENILPGPYWYHAHAHGVAEMQVGCGLSGSFYVEGAIPAYIKALQERFKPLVNGKDKNVAANTKALLSAVESTLPQLPHHLLVLKDFWTPGLGPINGPLEQSVNGKVTYTNQTINTTQGTPYVINYGAADQIWEIINQSANLNYALTFTGVSGNNVGFYVLGRDGMPKSDGLSMQLPDNALLIPPAGRATVVVPTDLFGNATPNVITQEVNTQGGDDYFVVGSDVSQNPNPWNLITLTPDGSSAPAGVTPWGQLATAINQSLSSTSSAENADKNFSAHHPVDATYVFFEPQGAEPAPPRLPPEPAQFSFYRLADKHGTYWKQSADVYDNFEPPIAHLTPGQPQRWIIQNQTLEWHDFHLHQVHFRVEKFTVIDPRNAGLPEANLKPPQENQGNPFYAVNEPPPAGIGKNPGDPFYSGEVDTVSIPNGVQVWLTIPMTEGPQIAGHFVMHCHILEHEDGGMMANVTAGDAGPVVAQVSKTPPHLPALEVAQVKFAKPEPLKDSTGKDCNSDVFAKSDLSLVTFGYTTCEGACPMTVEKCSAALAKLAPQEKERVAPFFVSLDAERDNPEKLATYAKEHELNDSWKLLLDSKLVATRAFGALRKVIKRPDGSVSIRHTTTIYLIDRSMHIRAAFDEQDTTESMSERIEKELNSPGASPAAAGKAARG